jgi:hypothetical protein
MRRPAFDLHGWRGFEMIENVFDPAMETEPLTVQANPGRIIIGKTNFLEPSPVYGLELSPIQAALLVLTLTRAIEAELEYSTYLEKNCGGGHEFL